MVQPDMSETISFKRDEGDRVFPYLSTRFTESLPEVDGGGIGVLETLKVDAESLLEDRLAEILAEHAIHGVRLGISDSIVDLVQLVRIVNLHLKKKFPS